MTTKHERRVDTARLAEELYEALADDYLEEAGERLAEAEGFDARD
jgi:hypothetical protein